MDWRKRDCLWLGLLAAVMLGLWTGNARAITGSQIIERMQKSFAGHKSFSAQFEKQFYWALLGNRKRGLKGRIYTRRPNQFRVELESGDVVVADGEAIWSYAHQNQQVVVNAYEGALKTPWEILLDYTEHYAPLAVEEDELEGRPCYALVLKPRTEGYVAQLKIWVDRKRWHLLKAEQVEVSDNVTTYILRDHRINKKLDPELFSFDPPEGADIIDRREPEPPND